MDNRGVSKRGMQLLNNTTTPKPSGCQHRRVSKVYTDDSYGTSEKQYCADCGEFIQLCYYERRKAADFGGNQTVWSQ